MNQNQPMPRSNLKKVDMLSKVYKMKTSLYDGTHRDKSAEWHDGAHDALTKVLNFINEYAN